MRPDWLFSGPVPPAFATEERCEITETLNLAASPEASLALARVAPGVTTQLHAVEGTTERYVIVSGSGVAEVGGETAAIAPGDRVIVPAGMPQRVTNTGAGDLVFWCLCTPRFRPEAYRNLEA